MTRVVTFVALLMLVPAVTAAQNAPPPPPTPVTPPAPPAPAPPPPMPAPMALPGVWAMPAPWPPIDVPDAWVVAPPAVAWPMEPVLAQDVRRLEEQARQMAREAAEQARVVREINVDEIRERAREAAEAAEAFRYDFGFDMDFQERRIAPMGLFAQDRRSADSSAYSSAISALSRRNYEDAVTRFDRVIVQKGPHADAAMHWKAFAQFKLGRSQDALATITALRSDYPQSRYLGDAKVLEADVRRTAGQPANPAAIDDDELKLLAIQGLQRSDPNAAVPLLEGVLTANNSLRVKQNALYVLALSDLPRAHEILMSYAKGGGNPDLQLQAISYLASRRDKQTTSADLRAIYEATDDTSVRLAIISAYRASGDKVSLVSIASNGSAPVAIRSRALSNLSNLAAPQELWSLYQKEASADLRMQMLSAFNSMKSVEHLTMAAKTEKDPPVRRRAIRYLGGQAPEATGQTLIDLYSADLDVETRKSIIEALSQQTNAEALVAIARKDSSPEVLRDVVVRLSAMAKTSPAAASFLAEIIKR